MLLPLRPARISSLCRAFSRVVSNFDRTALQATDILDLSFLKTPTFHVASLGSEINKAVIPLAYYKRFEASRYYDIAFPPKTFGFLYYDEVHPCHPICGEPRFRVTSEPSPDSFCTGKDLLKPNGRVWRLPIHRIAQSEKYAPLADHLVQVGLVPASLVEHLRNIKSLNIQHDTPAIWDLGQSFDFELSSHTWRLAVGRGKNIRRLVGRNPFSDGRRSSSQYHYPYKGNIRCRFELLPAHSDGCTRLGLWVLEVDSLLSSVAVDYDGYVAKPSPGALLSKDFGLTPLAFTVDSKSPLRDLLSDDPGYVASEPPRPAPRRNLLPKRLTMYDFVDASGMKKIPLGTETFLPYNAHAAIPPGTRGFPYYTCYNPEHPASGKIRFRITIDAQPANFSDGYDFLNPDGTAWSTNVASAARYHKNLRDLLTEAEVVTAEQWEQYLEAVHRQLDLSKAEAHLWLASGNRLVKVVTRLFRCTEDGIRLFASPYKGFATGKFESSVNKRGVREINFRAVKPLSDVECVKPGYDGFIPEPTEGTLLIRGHG